MEDTIEKIEKQTPRGYANAIASLLEKKGVKLSADQTYLKLGFKYVKEMNLGEESKIETVAELEGLLESHLTATPTAEPEDNSPPKGNSASAPRKEREKVEKAGLVVTPDIQAILDGEGTRNDKVRALLSLGVTIRNIYPLFVGMTYQRAKNVAKALQKQSQKSLQVAESELVSANGSTSSQIAGLAQSLKELQYASYKEFLTLGMVVPNPAKKKEDHEYWNGEEAAKMKAELIRRLTEITPIGYSFGIGNNGNSYGYWKSL